MPIAIEDTLGILADNLRLRRSVLPIPVESATRWTAGLGLPRGGETVLYTGLMYQLIPYIEALVAAEVRLGDSWLARFSAFGRQVNRLLDVSSVLARPSAAAQAAYDRVPRNVALLLKRAGVTFGSLYEDDLYSGALVYDLGADEAFEAHAHRVYEALRKNGVRRAITIDPHTTNMLRSVYPRVIEGYDLRVESYLEVLAKTGMQAQRDLGEEVVIHDSCVLARYEGVVDEPRRLLEGAGVTVQEPEHSGRQTLCCGGPAESLFPRKAEAFARSRVAELAAAGRRAVTMCPICLVNLSKAAGDSLALEDISDYLRRAYDA